MGFIAALEGDGGLGEVVNFGSSYEISIGDTVRLIAEVMGVDVEISTDEERVRPVKSEVERLWAANDKAGRLFGWRPAYAGIDGLRRGLKKTADWFINPVNLAQYKTGRYNI